jgi:hypothetical protein
LDTGEPLPGVETGRQGSGTEKVRMKSIVERTRGLVAEVMSKGGDEDAENRVEDITDLETGDEIAVGEAGEMDGEVFSRLEMNVAKVYDRTVVELGDTIGTTPIGIITDE